jgi:hypothetical protein
MPTFQDLLNILSEQAASHWFKFATALACIAAGWYLGKWRARKIWKRKEFFHRVNISLNSFGSGKLLIRTLMEKDAEQIFQNSTAVEHVIAAARRTTADDPIVPLPKDDYWYFLNAVLNAVTELFAEGEIRRDLGLPVRSERYLLCLTREVEGDLRMQKIRVMVIQKKILQGFLDAEPQLERTVHLTRWQTLRRLAAAYREHPYKFMEMEITVPDGA